MPNNIFIGVLIYFRLIFGLVNTIDLFSVGGSFSLKCLLNEFAKYEPQLVCNIRNLITSAQKLVLNANNKTLWYTKTYVHKKIFDSHI